MNTHELPDWPAGDVLTSPMYQPLQSLLNLFTDFQCWPGLNDYQRLLDSWPVPIVTASGVPLKIVSQDGKPGCFEAHYAPRIYTTGEIQTRTENWHDFFQYLTWFIFPKTKAVINSIHIPLARERITKGIDLGRRSPVENMLSLFDEGGAVVISSDKSLLQLIRDFRWKELFWQRRNELGAKLKCITFGHAMYEKGLAPYLGMTANTILLTAETSFFDMDQSQQLKWLDEQLAGLFSKGVALKKPKDLSPFPILGMPGWDPDNSSEAYYDNMSYFRPGRRQSA